MSKVDLGDIFEIGTEKGKAYFQCINIDKERCDTIKVFNKLYDVRPLNIEEVTHESDCYFVGFPLGAAHRRKLVEKVGNLPLSKDFKLPEYTRDKHVIRKEFLGWHIVNTSTLKRQFVKELSAAQKQLSPCGVWNDTLLKEMLERGWNLKNW